MPNFKKKKTKLFYNISPPNWEAQFPNISQKKLPRILSDHSPLLLDCGLAVRSSRYFKFENVVEVGGICETIETLMDAI
jgi:hypothetical protein